MCICNLYLYSTQLGFRWTREARKGPLLMCVAQGNSGALGRVTFQSGQTSQRCLGLAMEGLSMEGEAGRDSPGGREGMMRPRQGERIRMNFHDRQIQQPAIHSRDRGMSRVGTPH